MPGEVLSAAGLILALLVPVSVLGTRQVAQALRALAQSSERLRRLDFGQRPASVAHVADPLRGLVVTAGDAAARATTPRQLQRLLQVLPHGLAGVAGRHRVQVQHPPRARSPLLKLVGVAHQ